MVLRECYLLGLLKELCKNEKLGKLYFDDVILYYF